jgi:hypothetical protein
MVLVDDLNSLTTLLFNIEVAWINFLFEEDFLKVYI